MITAAYTYFTYRQDTEEQREEWQEKEMWKWMTAQHRPYNYSML